LIIDIPVESAVALAAYPETLDTTAERLEQRCLTAQTHTKHTRHIAGNATPLVNIVDLPRSEPSGYIVHIITAVEHVVRDCPE